MKPSTQLAVVVCVGIVAGTALVYGLAVFAHWSDGAVVGLVAAVGVAAGTLVAQLRSNSKLADQDKTLATIERQTNGLSEVERQDIATRAARAVLAAQKEQGR